jgi:GNAT superfamily N-acetyltransferase
MAGGEEITTFLEMREAPSLQATPPHRAGMMLRIGEPSVPFYRYLMERAGLPGEEDDAEAAALLGDEAYDIYVLYLGGVPAGIYELDRRTPGDVELIRVVVFDGFGGRGLGKYLLAAAVETAWGHGPERVWVRTTNRDDPRWILMLQWAGFIPYETTRERSG